eukprot:TRINITY_DN833_c0_g1_i1.p1 TRINITY_DN833_c0_g1~~TRINITY_DN833_c0_g1_i1.p1  ORF type:complete len:694 (-),score=206.94 TRINITY_DN833_c0_g1_i1:63-2144(-)
MSLDQPALHQLISTHFKRAGDAHNIIEAKDQRCIFVDSAGASTLVKRTIYVIRDKEAIPSLNLKAFLTLGVAKTTTTSSSVDKRDHRKFTFRPDDLFVVIGATDDKNQRHILHKIGGSPCPSGCKCTQRRTDVPQKCFEILCSPYQYAQGPFFVTNVGLARRDRQPSGIKQKQAPDIVVVEILMDGHPTWVEQSLSCVIAPGDLVDSLMKANGCDSTGKSSTCIPGSPIREAVKFALSLRFDFLAFPIPDCVIDLSPSSPTLQAEKKAKKRLKGEFDDEDPILMESGTQNSPSQEFICDAITLVAATTSVTDICEVMLPKRGRSESSEVACLSYVSTTPSGTQIFRMDSKSIAPKPEPQHSLLPSITPPVPSSSIPPSNLANSTGPSQVPTFTFTPSVNNLRGSQNQNSALRQSQNSPLFDMYPPDNSLRISNSNFIRTSANGQMPDMAPASFSLRSTFGTGTLRSTNIPSILNAVDLDSSEYCTAGEENFFPRSSNGGTVGSTMQTSLPSLHNLTSSLNGAASLTTSASAPPPSLSALSSLALSLTSSTHSNPSSAPLPAPLLSVPPPSTTAITATTTSTTTTTTNAPATATATATLTSSTSSSSSATATGTAVPTSTATTASSSTTSSASSSTSTSTSSSAPTAAGAACSATANANCSECSAQEMDFYAALYNSTVGGDNNGMGFGFLGGW